MSRLIRQTIDRSWSLLFVLDTIIREQYLLALSMPVSICFVRFNPSVYLYNLCYQYLSQGTTPNRGSQTNALLNIHQLAEKGKNIAEIS